MQPASSHRPEESEAPWRAPANPWYRRLLDLLRTGPRTTGALAAALPDLSRYAVMQRLGVLTEAGLVLVVRHLQDAFASELTALSHHRKTE